MKTKLLILAALVFAGLTFSSCTKDNSLADEASSWQTTNTKTEWTPDPGGIGNDMITNAPDPFRNYTAIFYQVPGNNEIVGGKFVSLVVINKKSEIVAVLIKNEFQKPGRYEVKFDASKLPYGKYTAELTISSETLSVVYKEEMTKSALWHQDDESAVID